MHREPCENAPAGSASGGSRASDIRPPCAASLPPWRAPSCNAADDGSTPRYEHRQLERDAPVGVARAAVQMDHAGLLAFDEQLERDFAEEGQVSRDDERLEDRRLRRPKPCPYRDPPRGGGRRAEDRARRSRWPLAQERPSFGDELGDRRFALRSAFVFELDLAWVIGERIQERQRRHVAGLDQSFDRCGNGVGISMREKSSEELDRPRLRDLGQQVGQLRKGRIACGQSLQRTLDSQCDLLEAIPRQPCEASPAAWRASGSSQPKMSTSKSTTRPPCISPSRAATRTSRKDDSSSSSWSRSSASRVARSSRGRTAVASALTSWSCASRTARSASNSPLSVLPRSSTDIARRIPAARRLCKQRRTGADGLP